MGVRHIGRSLERWELGVKDLQRRMILAPTPRELALRRAQEMVRRAVAGPGSDGAFDLEVLLPLSPAPCDASDKQGRRVSYQSPLPLGLAMAGFMLTDIRWRNRPGIWRSDARALLWSTGPGR